MGRVRDRFPVNDPEFLVADQYSEVLTEDSVGFVPPASELNDSTVITGLEAAVVAN